jgi:hypothetical protein
VLVVQPSQVVQPTGIQAAIPCTVWYLQAAEALVEVLVEQQLHQDLAVQVEVVEELQW